MELDQQREVKLAELKLAEKSLIIAILELRMILTLVKVKLVILALVAVVEIEEKLDQSYHILTSIKTILTPICVRLRGMPHCRIGKKMIGQFISVLC